MANSKNTRLVSGSKPKKRRLIDYPRHGKTGIRRWLPSWRFVLGTFLTLGAMGAGLLIAAYASVKIPEPQDMAIAQITTVYYSDGKTEMGQFAQVERKLIEDADSIPDYVGQAVVAAEDRTFYTNRGVDLKGMARAMYINITQNKQQGGSTITQQYAENYYMGSTGGGSKLNAYAGKLKEALMSMKLAQESDKDEILMNYMNTIYYGRGASGIEVAAERYFGKPAAELTVEEAALIAGVIPAPSKWDPRASEDAAVQAERRWNYVLDGMVTLNFISAAERAEMVFPETIEYEKGNQFKGTKGYLIEEIRKEVLSKTGMDQDELETAGLKIVSTFDKNLQKKLVAAVKTLPEDAAKNLSVGGVTVDPKTGGVLAMYGGKDYVKKQFNNATQGMAQAGSTFKPFTLLAALKQEIPLEGQYFNGNSPRTFDDNGSDYKVNNFGGTSYGYLNLVKATANSVNTAYVELNQEVGPQATVDAAISLGIPPETIDLTPVLSNVLGTATVRPIDMAGAYATFAANGQRHNVHTVASVARSDGKLIYEPSNLPDVAYDPEIGAELTHALTEVVKTGSGKKALAIGHPIAGKTGTSNSNKSAWFVGYTPSYATAISLYQSGPEGQQESITPFGGYAEITGSSVPLDLWVNYMTAVLEGKEPEEFPERTLKPVFKPTPTPTVTEEEKEEVEEEPTEEETEEPQPEPSQTQTQQPQPEPSQTQTQQPQPQPTQTQQPQPEPTQTQEPEPEPTKTPTPTPTQTQPPAPTQSPTPTPTPSASTSTSDD